MQMTEEEIVRNYKEAKRKSGYIQILADLNACSKANIVKILKKHNVPLPGKPKKEETINPTTMPSREPIATNVLENEKKFEKIDLDEPSTPSEPVDTPKGIIMNTKINIPDTVKIVIENEINNLKKQKEEIDAKIRELQDFIKKNS